MALEKQSNNLSPVSAEMTELPNSTIQPLHTFTGSKAQVSTVRLFDSSGFEHLEHAQRGSGSVAFKG